MRLRGFDPLSSTTFVMPGSTGPQSGLGRMTETLRNDRALLVEVADAADVQVRKSDIRGDVDVDDVTITPALT